MRTAAGVRGSGRLKGVYLVMVVMTTIKSAPFGHGSVSTIYTCRAVTEVEIALRLEPLSA